MPSTDRNLLVGVLALQMDFIDRGQLVAAMNAWVLRKDQTLDAILLDQGALDERTHGLLSALVERHLELHEGSPSRSLASLSSLESIRQELSRIEDDDILASLATAASDPHAQPETVRLPPRVGEPRFRVLRPHARGGLGEVFVAHDSELNREVALKEIQERHATDANSRARFLMEAEVTGGLEHPGIVPVYGLGQYGNGNPYYAMRFIRGDSLREAIVAFHKTSPLDDGERSLQLRKLLGRFVDVCNAIQYAHSRGVLHRDLKPGNIMLGRYGETLVVDWGLAKVHDRPDTNLGTEEGPLQPHSGTGTAPTQYGSAVGTPAYMSPEQAAGRLNELGPTSDVYSLGATLYHLLTGQPPFQEQEVGTLLRKVQSGEFAAVCEVAPDIARPLDAICRKAMATQPGDRYETPLDLSEDIERWLADEPVRAWREPLPARAQRWCRKHRTLVSTSAALLVAAVVGLGASTVLINEQKAVAEKNFRIASEQKARAEENYELALTAVDRFFTRVSEDRLLDEPGMKPLRRDLLETARTFYEQFIDKQRDDNRTRGELARALIRQAEITEQIGQSPEALRLAQESRDLLTVLLAEQPSDTLHRDYVRSLQTLGSLQQVTGDLEEAERTLVEAREVARELARKQPADATLADLLAHTHLYLGRLYFRTGKLTDVEREWTAAQEIAAELVVAEPRNETFRGRLSASHNAVAAVYYTTGAYTKAKAAYEASIAAAKELCHQHPDSIEHRSELANRYANLALLLMQTAEYEDGKEVEQEAIAILEQLAREHPGVAAFEFDTSRCLMTLGNLHWYTRDYGQAVEAQARAVAIREKLVAEHPTVIRYATNLARNYQALGLAQHNLGDLDAAGEAYLKAEQRMRQLLRDNPDVPKLRRDLAGTQNSLSAFYQDTGQLDKARDSLTEAIAFYEGLVKDQPNVAEYEMGHSQSRITLGSVLRKQGETAAALAAYDHAREILETIRNETDLEAETARWLANLYMGRAETLEGADRPTEALADWDKALAVVDEPRREEFQRSRLLTLALTPDYTAAVSQIDGMLQQSPSEPAVLVSGALIHAAAARTAATDGQRAPSERSALSAGFIQRSINLLRRAHETGSGLTREGLRENRHLQILQSEPEFEELLKTLDSVPADPAA